MSPEEQQARPKHRSFELTPERELLPRYRAARCAIVIYFVVLLASFLVLCSCPGFFVVMAVCAVVALLCGSRLQRLLSTGLLLLAIVGFFVELKEERRLAEKVHELGLRNQKRLHEQQLPQP